MNDSTPRPRTLALLAGFATIYLVWGSTYLGIRVAVAYLPPFLMSAIRFAVAGIVLQVFLRLRGVAPLTALQWRRQAIAGLLLLVFSNGVVGWAEQAVPSGLTTLILGASPVTIILMEQLRPGGTRASPGIWLGVFTGIAGIFLLLGPGAFPSGQRPPWTSVAALVFASTCWWAGSLFNKHRGGGGHGLMAASAQMLVASASLTVLGLVAGEGNRFHPTAVPLRAWAAVAYLVVMGSLVAYPTYLWLLRHSTPARVSTFAYVNPVVAVLLGWAILGEPLNLRIWISAAVIIAAVAIITVQRNRPIAPAASRTRSAA